MILLTTTGKFFKNIYQTWKNHKIYMKVINKKCSINRKMSANSGEGFKTEFDYFKDSIFSTRYGIRIASSNYSCNQHKNRYPNQILSYDHSRVILQPLNNENCSDYINANYLPVNHLLHFKFIHNSICAICCRQHS